MTIVIRVVVQGVLAIFAFLLTGQSVAVAPEFAQSMQEAWSQTGLSWSSTADAYVFENQLASIATADYQVQGHTEDFKIRVALGMTNTEDGGCETKGFIATPDNLSLFSNDYKDPCSDSLAAMVITEMFQEIEAKADALLDKVEIICKRVIESARAISY